MLDTPQAILNTPQESLWDVALVAVGLVGLTALAVSLVYIIPRFPDIYRYLKAWPSDLMRALRYYPQHKPETSLLRAWNFL